MSEGLKCSSRRFATVRVIPPLLVSATSGCIPQRGKLRS
jgi:hypothetical protein